jgi:hypothetical protein
MIIYRKFLFTLTILLAFSNFTFANFDHSTCLSDFNIQQKKILHKLSTNDLLIISDFAENANPILGWKKLADAGDAYAKMAYRVLANSNSPKSLLFKNLIRKHWINTVGYENFSKYFNLVAIQHFKQYVKIILTGYWPDSDQILMSYLQAVRDHNLPDETVFDATWDASGLNSLSSWQNLNHLNSARTVYPTHSCYNIDKNYALKILAEDFSVFK